MDGIVSHRQRRPISRGRLGATTVDRGACASRPDATAGNPDFRDLFAALNAAGAKYLLVGGSAVAFHAQPRFTKDLDIWTEPDAAKAARVHEALRGFGAPLQELTIADLERLETIFQIGVPPNRIDIVTAIDGVGFHEAWLGRTETTYGDQSVPVIGAI